MTNSKDCSSPVLIIGAGLAGLALAQILKSQSIPFQIFERDFAPTVRCQGWAVALTQCLPRLASLLPQHLGDLHSTSVNAPISVPDVGAVLHPGSGDILAKIGGAPAGQPGHLIRAKRERLRAFLWEGLDVQCDKHFSHYSEDEQGVTAFFTDGTSNRGSLLIGVDGAHSPVRAQLLSQMAQPAPFIPIVGTATLSRSQYEPIHSKGSAAVIAGDDDLRWLLSLVSIEPDRASATYFYAVCYRPNDPQSETEWARHATKAELFDKVISLTTSTPQFFQHILHDAGVEAMLTPPLRFVEFEPPATLPNGRVTLAGDAAHTMMPFKGAGANTAFLDICDLAELLIESKTSGHDLADKKVATGLLRRYEGTVLPRGKIMVAGSGATGKSMEEIIGAGKTMGPEKGGLLMREVQT